MLPGQRFNELYKILDKLIRDRCIYADINVFHISYWDEIAVVELRSNDGYKLLKVSSVEFLDGTPDYNYFSDKEPELESWLMRPNVERCVVELEKTIFELN